MQLQVYQHSKIIIVFKKIRKINTFAIIHKTFPIVSPEENSATAGASGAKSDNFNPFNNDKYCAGDLNFCDLINLFLTGLENLIGTSDMISVPPTIAVSIDPDLINEIAFVVAAFEEIQAIVTVWAGVDNGIPA